MSALAWLLAAALAVPGHSSATPAPARVLRVCADPNNLPFSNQAGEGLENRLVQLLATQLHARVEYHWQPQRRGFVRQGLSAGECDLVPGYASAVGRIGTTRPYYRSSYMFVARRPEDLPESFDDPTLKRLRVGVQLVGDDGANAPPAQSLAQRGIVANVRGYTVYGDYASAAPQSQIIDALRRGDIDVAVVWGPTAGYFGGRDPALPMARVQPWLDGPQLPMVYEVSVGVRKEDVALRRELDRALDARRAEVDALLREFRVPQVP